MTVVYLDAFLVLNFVVNYLLLACAGKLDGEPVGRGRTALAAALGAAYGGLALLPDWGFLEHPQRNGQGLFRQLRGGGQRGHDQSGPEVQLR